MALQYGLLEIRVRIQGDSAKQEFSAGDDLVHRYIGDWDDRPAKSVLADVIDDLDECYTEYPTMSSMKKRIEALELRLRQEGIDPATVGVVEGADL